MNAQQLFEAGQLDDAVAAQLAEVKIRPADLGCRTFYFELLAFQGDLERADKQLDVLGQQDIERDPIAQIYRNLLVAERSRRALWSDGVKPHFLLDPPPDIERHLQAVNRLREGNAEEAASLLAEADAMRHELRGTLDGEPFEGFRDCDDILAPVLEVFIGRDYCWLPLAQIRELTITPPGKPRDLLWAGCQVTLTDGVNRSIFLPVLYVGSHQHENDQMKLGRMTDWIEHEGGPIQGCGHRLFLAGEMDRPVLEIRSLTFDTDPLAGEA